MSGALIYAVLPASALRGPRVALSAALGQDPSVPYQYQGISMDLGTTVLPFTTTNVAKPVDKPNVCPGEEMQYTIRISNVGQRQVEANSLVLFDQILGLGESSTVIVETVMSASLVNTATVIGNPVFAYGRDIEGLVYVQASNPSEVEVTPSAPAIILANTVKREDGRDCTSSVESLSDIVGTEIEYCFR